MSDRKTETLATTQRAAAVTPEDGHDHDDDHDHRRRRPTAADTPIRGSLPADTAVITADPSSFRSATRRGAGGEPARRHAPGDGERSRRLARERASRRARSCESRSTSRSRRRRPRSATRSGASVWTTSSPTTAPSSPRRAAASSEGSRTSWTRASSRRPAELRFRLTELETRGGTFRSRRRPTSAWARPTRSANVEYIAGGAAVGAIVGQVLGKDTESTLKGAAAGAAVGTGSRRGDRGPRLHDRAGPHGGVHAGGAAAGAVKRIENDLPRPPAGDGSRYPGSDRLRDLTASTGSRLRARGPSVAARLGLAAPSQ